MYVGPMHNYGEVYSLASLYHLLTLCGLFRGRNYGEVYSLASLYHLLTLCGLFRGHNYGEVYSLASLYHGEQNERRKCSQLPDIDFTKWKAA